MVEKLWWGNTLGSRSLAVGRKEEKKLIRGMKKLWIGCGKTLAFFLVETDGGGREIKGHF